MKRSYTNIEQSKKLAEIVPNESADMYYLANDREPRFIPESFGLNEKKEMYGSKLCIPCWSLEALIDLLPESLDMYGDNIQRSSLEITKYDQFCICQYSYEFMDGKSFEHVGATGNTFVEACYNMLIKLNEEGMI